MSTLRGTLLSRKSAAWKAFIITLNTSPPLSARGDDRASVVFAGSFKRTSSWLRLCWQGKAWGWRRQPGERERGGREGPLRSRSLLHVAELQIEDLVFGLLLTLRLPSPPLPQRMVDVVRHSHVLFRPVQLYSLLWLVWFSPVALTPWCFSCNSGKRASMFVLFFYLPIFKMLMN